MGCYFPPAVALYAQHNLYRPSNNLDSNDMGHLAG